MDKKEYRFKTIEEIGAQEDVLAATVFKDRSESWLTTRRFIHTNPQKSKEILRALANQDKRYLDILYDWDLWVRPEQMIDTGVKPTTLMLCGRSFGKTHFSSNHAIKLATQTAGTRIALWAPDFGAAKRVNWLSEAGIIRNIHPELLRQCEFNKSDLTLSLPNGSTIVTYSGESYDKSRGDSVHYNVIDEIASYSYSAESLEAARLIARLGENPRTLIFTTPRPTSTIMSLAEDDDTHLILGTSYDNYFITPKYVEGLKKNLTERMYRQEILAEILSDNLYALFQMSNIIANRVEEIDFEDIRRIVIAIDPAVTSNEDSDLTGIVVSALGMNGEYYVLEDKSQKQASPDQWSKVVVDLYKKYSRLGQTSIVAESNQGGDMVASVVKNASRRERDIILPPVKLVRATKGKALRAEPVAALYEQNIVHHVGEHTSLESEMTDWNPTEKNSKSPDRLDALVWGITDLMKSGGGHIMSGYGGAPKSDEESTEYIYSGYF